MVLDTKLDFNLNLKNVQSINVRKLQNILLRQSLIIICKSFIRPHLDYGDYHLDNL